MSPKFICLSITLLLFANFSCWMAGKNKSRNRKYAELAYSPIFVPNESDCEGIRIFWLAEMKKYGHDKMWDVTRPIGWQNCFLFNISNGMNERKRQNAPPQFKGKGSINKLRIVVENFFVKNADDLEIEEHLHGKLNILLYLVLSWEDIRLKTMDEWADQHIDLQNNLTWIWTPELIVDDKETFFECFGCFIKKVGLYLLPNRRVRALYSLRLREHCHVDYSRFPIETAYCERQIAIGLEGNLKCQEGIVGQQTAADNEHLERIIGHAYLAFLSSNLDPLKKKHVWESRMSQKWLPEENSIQCRPSNLWCLLNQEDCDKKSDDKMTLKMTIILEKGPIREICLWAIILFAICAFCLRRENSKLLTAFAFLFVTLLCLFMASIQRPPHGFQFGKEPKILKFYKTSFFIAVSNLLGILLLQLVASINAISLPYRWILMARFLNELPQNLLTKRHPGERLVEEEDGSATACHGQAGVEQEAGGNHAKSSNGNKMASDSEFWQLIDKMLCTILVGCFVAFFIWMMV